MAQKMLFTVTQPQFRTNQKIAIPRLTKGNEPISRAELS